MKPTWLHPGILLLGLAGLATPLRAELPEPDNIIFGTVSRNGAAVLAADTDVVVAARRDADGTVVASYRMGDSARAGNHFTLRVPLEAFLPILDPLASPTGTPLTIVASDFNGSFAEVPFTQGDRGQIHRVNLTHVIGFDTDSDGLNDEWETFWFGNLLRNASTDTDGDGATDGDEYLAGTNPTDPTSRFRLTIQRTGATGKEISFLAVAAAGSGYQGKSRKYTLEWTADLSGNTWTPLAGYIEVTGAGQTVRYGVPPQAPATGFYRTVIQLTDVGPPLPQ